MFVGEFEAVMNGAEVREALRGHLAGAQSQTKASEPHMRLSPLQKSKLQALLEPQMTHFELSSALHLSKCSGLARLFSFS
jgi:hypothetical protein